MELKGNYLSLKTNSPWKARRQFLCLPEIPGVPDWNGKTSQVPSWLTSYIKPNASTSVDFSYMAKMGLKLRTTTISGGIKMIGAGYNTLGNPNLINDRMTYDGRIDQTFAKNQVTFSVFYRQSNDNLVHWKAGTTTTVSYGITAGLRLRKAPYFMVSYMPNFQKTNNDSLKLNNSIYMVTASTGYFYKIGKVNMNTGFNYSRQYSRIIRDTATDLSTTNSYALNQDMNFKIPLSFTIGANYSQSFLSKENQDILSLTLSGNYRAFKDKWENSLGVRYSDQSHKQTKLGYFLNSIVRISKIADIGIQIEKNTFRNDPQCTKNYDEFIAKFTFGIRW